MAKESKGDKKVKKWFKDLNEKTTQDMLKQLTKIGKY